MQGGSVEHLQMGPALGGNVELRHLGVPFEAHDAR
jgi:hypothetical protein